MKKLIARWGIRVLDRLGIHVDEVRAVNVDGIGTVVFSPDLTTRCGDEGPLTVNVKVERPLPVINERRFVVENPGMVH